MTTTAQPTTSTPSVTTARVTPAPDTRTIADRAAPAGVDIGARAAGFGALGFAVCVIAQNVVRSSAPQPGDDIAEVVTHYADHRAVTVVLLVTFVASLGALVTFLAGSAKRLLASSRRGFAALGIAGATTVIGLFAAVVASEQALSVIAQSDDPDLGAASALWAFHNSVFTVNLVFIGFALLGLAWAGIAAGVTPSWLGPVAPVGAGLLALGTVAGPYLAAGDALPVFGISVIGFVVWLVFMVATGVRLVRAGTR